MRVANAARMTEPRFMALSEPATVETLQLRNGHAIIPPIEILAMSTITEPKTYTPDDLMRMPDGNRYELVDGRLVERNVSALSSIAPETLLRQIGNYCEANLLAWVIGADCGYQCFPGHPRKVRKPDGSVVLRDRLSTEQLEEGFLTLPPDLAIEAVSPNDLAYEVEQKVEEYLGAGVCLVWVIYPTTRKIHIHRRDGSTAVVRSGDELAGEDVLPGFTCRVGDLFASVPA
jgi:Uma2 family endonuclease